MRVRVRVRMRVRVIEDLREEEEGDELGIQLYATHVGVPGGGVRVRGQG